MVTFKDRKLPEFHSFPRRKYACVTESNKGDSDNID